MADTYTSVQQLLEASDYIYPGEDSGFTEMVNSVTGSDYTGWDYNTGRSEAIVASLNTDIGYNVLG